MVTLAKLMEGKEARGGRPSCLENLCKDHLVTTNSIFFSCSVQLGYSDPTSLNPSSTKTFSVRYFPFSHFVFFSQKKTFFLNWNRSVICFHEAFYNLDLPKKVWFFFTILAEFLKWYKRFNFFIKFELQWIFLPTFWYFPTASDFKSGTWRA